jgi:hypothetical protein
MNDENKESPQFGIFEILRTLNIFRRIKKGGENMNWILTRLSEPSTWRGIVGLLTTAGVIISPTQADKIIAFGIALVALIEVLRKEKTV